MRKYILSIALLALALGACKTTEANYRAAYDKAVSAREAQDDDADNLFGGVQRQMSTTFVLDGKDSIAVSVKHVSIVTEDNKPAAEMKTYKLVGGQFKQKFNAMSLCRRYADAGWPDAIVVQTSEPYYYIVVGSYATAREAADAMKKLEATSPVKLQEPSPFILVDPRDI